MTRSTAAGASRPAPPKGGPAHPDPGGAICGTLLFVASAAQQIGITLNPSTAKASFITAMYVVLVPVVGLLFGRKSPSRSGGCVVLSVAGLYLLCMKDGFGNVEASDGVLLLCAFLFTFQIMGVDHFSPRVDGVRLSMLQFFVVAVESTIASLLTETVTLSDLTRAALPVIYCGVLSSGVAYTLQILGQRGSESRHCQPGHVPGERPLAPWAAGCC